MMKKRVISIVLAISYCLTLLIPPVNAAVSVSAGQSDEITVSIDGLMIIFPDAKPYIDGNGRVQVPVRFIGEALGARVVWDEELQMVTFRKRAEISGSLEVKSVIFNIGENIYSIHVKTGDAESYQDLTMDTEPVIVQDRTYAPARYVAEALGAGVSWDGNTNTVIINTAGIALNTDGATNGQLPASTPIPKPAPQTGAPPSVIFLSYDWLSLEWEHIDNTMEYIIECAESDKNFREVATLSGDKNEYTVNDLKPATIYFFRIRSNGYVSQERIVSTSLSREVMENPNVKPPNGIDKNCGVIYDYEWVKVDGFGGQWAINMPPFDHTEGRYFVRYKTGDMRETFCLDRGYVVYTPILGDYVEESSPPADTERFTGGRRSYYSGRRVSHCDYVNEDGKHIEIIEYYYQELSREEIDFQSTIRVGY